MTAVETVCRYLAFAAYDATHPRTFSGDLRKAWVALHWMEYENSAKQLLRDLKGQPVHVTDAGDLDAMLEAMTR